MDGTLRIYEVQDIANLSSGKCVAKKFAAMGNKMSISCISWCKNEALGKNGVLAVGAKEREMWKTSSEEGRS